VVEAAATDVGNVFSEGKVRVKDYAKVASVRRGLEEDALESDGWREDFGPLLRGANQKIFSFGRVD
jgi:hypothetical protein